MSKQLELNKTEKRDVVDLITALASILVEKMDQGVDAPHISGKINLEGEGKEREIIFSIKAQNKET